MDTDTVVAAAAPVVAAVAEAPAAPAAPAQPMMMPEAPGAGDLLAAVACLVASEALKVWSETKDKAMQNNVKRLIPIVSVFVGALVKTAYEMGTSGEPLQTAVVRGAIAGAMAVYAHSAGKGVTGNGSFLSDAVRAVIGRKKKADAPAPADKPADKPADDKAV